MLIHNEAINVPSPQKLGVPRPPNIAIIAGVPDDYLEKYNATAEQFGIDLILPAVTNQPATDGQRQEPPTEEERPSAVIPEAQITELPLSPTLTPTPVVQGPDTEFPEQMKGEIYEGDLTTPTCFPLFALIPFGFLALFTGRNQLSRNMVILENSLQGFKKRLANYIHKKSS